jgi:hypothetical protein
MMEQQNRASFALFASGLHVGSVSYWKNTNNILYNRNTTILQYYSGTYRNKYNY